MKSSLPTPTCFRGDRKIGGESEAVVRRREGAAACLILGAKPHFFDYVHEKLMPNEATVEVVSAWLRKVQPDVVVTHWPLDTHENHHATSSLVWQSYLRYGTWVLYFFEVMTDPQTKGFRPEQYLDIERVIEVKKRAFFATRARSPTVSGPFMRRCSAAAARSAALSAQRLISWLRPRGANPCCRCLFSARRSNVAQRGW
jgi:LmbE family N-acetylglucosaminyl deacetylase